MITLLLALAAATAPAPQALAGAIAATGFRGAVAAEREGRPLLAEDAGRVRPWASVSKQVAAVLVMQQVEAGRIGLDTPAGAYLPALAGPDQPTVRQLLQHRAGLRNPEDSPKDAAGTPGFYTSGPTGFGWCLEERGKPGGEWRYNNCDTIVLGALLERVSGQSLPHLFATRIARPAGMTATGYVTAATRWPKDPESPTPAERATLVRYGAAGGLAGPASDMVRFDRALAGGRLIGPAALAELWKGDPALGYMALGQWAFSAPLKGCAGPQRIVERRGGIDRFQVRNLILPDKGASVALLTADGDFDFGEIWQGKGPSWAILSAAACP